MKGGPTAPSDTVHAFRAVWREPLLHFLVLGALLFGVNHWLGGRAEPDRIVVGSALLADIESELTERLGRPPTRAERAEALEEWKRTEVWYREGLKRGLDRDDPEVRARVASKMYEIEQRGWFPPRPTDAELDAWLQAHRALYEVPMRLSFRYVPVAQNETAAALASLESAQGATHERRGQRLDQVEAEFGPAFAKQLWSLPVGSAQVLESRTGPQAVRVLERDGGVPTREQIRVRLEADWKMQRAVDFRMTKTRELLSRYTVVEPAGTAPP